VFILILDTSGFERKLHVWCHKSSCYLIPNLSPFLELTDRLNVDRNSHEDLKYVTLMTEIANLFLRIYSDCGKFGFSC